VCSTAALQMDFPVIAAAVLGGKNLFTERGSAAETVISLLFIQTVGSGLVMLKADSYVYPLIIGVIIYIAVLAGNGVGSGRPPLARTASPRSHATHLALRPKLGGFAGSPPACGRGGAGESFDRDAK